jgi:hypothetical protein
VSCKLFYQHLVSLAVRGFINLKPGTCAFYLKKIALYQLHESNGVQLYAMSGQKVNVRDSFFLVVKYATLSSRKKN